MDGIEVIRTPLAENISPSDRFRTAQPIARGIPAGDSYMGNMNSLLNLSTADFTPLVFLKLQSGTKKDATLYIDCTLSVITGLSVALTVYEIDGIPSGAGPVAFIQNLNVGSTKTTAVSTYFPFGGYTPPGGVPVLHNVFLNSTLPKQVTSGITLGYEKVYAIGFHNLNVGPATSGYHTTLICVAERKRDDTIYFIS